MDDLLHEIFTTGLWLPLGILAYFILPTLVIYSSWFMNAAILYTPIAPYNVLPTDVENHLQTSREALEELGFVGFGPMALPNASPNAFAIIECFVNRSKNDLAMVTCVYGTINGAATQFVKYVEFIRRFHDENVRLLQTNNNGRPGIFGDPADERMFRFPMIQDVRQLYALHGQLADRETYGLRPYMRLDEEFSGDPIEYLQAVFYECFQRQADRGWLYLDESNQQWRTTLRGAVCMTWKELYPFKQIRTARLYALARRQLSEFNA